MAVFFLISPGKCTDSIHHFSPSAAEYFRIQFESKSKKKKKIYNFWTKLSIVIIIIIIITYTLISSYRPILKILKIFAVIE